MGKLDYMYEVHLNAGSGRINPADTLEVAGIIARQCQAMGYSATVHERNRNRITATQQSVASDAPRA